MVTCNNLWSDSSAGVVAVLGLCSLSAGRDVYSNFIHGASMHGGSMLPVVVKTLQPLPNVVRIALLTMPNHDF